MTGRNGHEARWAFTFTRDTRRAADSRSREREIRREAECCDESLWLLPDNRLQVAAPPIGPLS